MLTPYFFRCPMPRKTRRCKVCGAEFQAKVKDIERGYGICCSKVCSGYYHGKAPHGNIKQGELNHGNRVNSRSY